ncbi:hypothetical protein QTG54_009151 [Skeletonema marinoi]|uniref:Uncharacterized protein n=1 Tax=Skeletonema marinoi TaxID=267567 RepID=A0AAD9DAE4_9STRA|nr:hypothetical protein QTG54_009151 [Skeletonema marinoi]
MTAITSNLSRRSTPSSAKLEGKNVIKKRKIIGDSIVQRSVQSALDIHLTLRWWIILSTIAIINIGIWSYSCYLILYNNRKGEGNADGASPSSNENVNKHPYQRYHLFLSGVYVFVCAYRSFLPRIDLERYCLFDTRLSSIFLGRLAATIAEVSFAAQISLFLYHIGEVHDHVWTQRLALCLVPAIFTAQCFCWCGVVTLNHLYHAIEESIWAVSAFFISGAMGSLAYYQPESQHVGIVGMAMCMVFFVFMVTVDVPMYVKRWREGQQYMMKMRMSKDDEGKKKHMMYMNSFEGSIDAIERRVVTKSWHVWKEETVWLTMYFSTAVWLSLLLVHKSVQHW